jgi:hypothetical protein
MNPELQKALLELVEATKVVGAAAWDQAPLVLRDLLVAGMIEGAAVCVAGALFWCASVACLLGSFKASPERRRGSDFTSPRSCLRAWSVGLAIAGCVPVLVGGSQILTAWLAPRAYLVGLLR